NTNTDTGAYEYWVSDASQATLYVNSAWDSYSFGKAIEGETGKFYGINAFSSLTEIMYQGTSAGQTAQYPDTKTIVFTNNDTYYSDTYIKDKATRYYYLLYYSDNDPDDDTDNTVTLKGSVSNSSVTIHSERLYLMTAVAGNPGDYATNVASTNAKTFIIDDGLNLTVSTMLKVGDVVDSGDSRTGGVANLVVKNGSVNNFITLAPYSKGTVLKDGKIISTGVSVAVTDASYLRPNSVLTVHGTAETVEAAAAADSSKTATASDPVQYQMNRVAFADGGTLNVYSAHAKINHIRLYDVTDRTISATGAVVNFENAYVETFNGGSGDFFTWDSSSVTEAITINVKNSTWDMGSLVLNPNANAEVKLTASSLSAASVTNGGAIKMDVNSLITAASVDNTSGTITIDATGFAGGTQKLIDVTTKTGLAVDAIGLEHAGTGVRLVQGVDGDVYITDENQATLYVKSAYDPDENITTDGHIYGYNAFSDLSEICESGTGTGQAAEYLDTTKIEFKGGDTYTSGSYLLFYANNDIELTGDAADANVGVNSGRLYLMTAVSGDYTEANIAATTAKTFTITNGLNLTVSSMLKVGDVVDTGDSRTGGVANLVVEEGSVNNFVALASYSTMTVLKDGKVLSGNLSDDVKQASYLRPNAVLTVHGTAETVLAAGTVGTTKATASSALQYKMNRVAFTDGGTLNVYNARAQVNHIRLYEETSSIEMTNKNAVVNFDHAYVETFGGASGAFFTWDSGSEPEAITVNVTDSTWDMGSLVLNPNATGAVNLTRSGLTAASVTNAGAITMDAASLITAGSINNTGTITVDATGYNFATNGMKKVIDLAGSGVSITGTSATVTGNSNATLYHKADESDYYLVDVGRSTVYVDSGWTIGAFGVTAKQDATPVEKRYSGYNAFDTVNAAAAEAAGIVGGELVIQDGSYSEIIQLRGVKTTVEGGAFSKAVYGGSEVSSTSAEDEMEISNTIDIKTGTFNKFFVGGNKIDMGTSSYTVTGEEDETTHRTVAHTVNISGGEFDKIVAGGDRYLSGNFTVNGDIDMNISGGQFNYRVAGGLLNSTTTTGGAFIGKIVGDVNLKITGGSFYNSESTNGGCWIYGGCIAAQKLESYSTKTEIQGNVTITVDTAALTGTDTIDLGTIVVGSYGWSKIVRDDEETNPANSGNIKLVFTGDGSRITFADEAQIWGSCSGDDADANGKVIGESLVDGDRTLSFTGFNGTLACNKIKAFSHFELDGASRVTINDSCNLSGIENWTFKYGVVDDALSGLFGNFKNSFVGDKLYLSDLPAPGSVENLSWDIMTNSKENAFIGFGDVGGVAAEQRLKVYVGSTELTWDSNRYTGAGYALALTENNTRMTLTLA
ncbi:MAG: hypothetical protein IKP09_10605, partial [Lentisphaeria bacterium]|nr:hypothetical protein [Lentisphaeria bacterium]